MAKEPAPRTESVRIDRRLWLSLKRLAHAEGRTISGMLKVLIEDALRIRLKVLTTVLRKKPDKEGGDNAPTT